MLGGWIPHAHAQISGTISLASNEMFRGESVSGNDPAVSAAFSLDSDSGLFAGASASIAAGGESPRLTSATQYAGYAIRKGQVSAEVGVIHRRYQRVVDTAYRRDYFEIYAGISTRTIKARVYVSPDYLVDGRSSYYGEVNARLLAVGKWSLDGHAGLHLIPPDIGSAKRGLRNYQDWRVQVSRPLGKVFVSAGIAGTNYPVFSPSGKARVFASISRAF